MANSITKMLELLISTPGAPALKSVAADLMLVARGMQAINRAGGGRGNQNLAAGMAAYGRASKGAANDLVAAATATEKLRARTEALRASQMSARTSTANFRRELQTLRGTALDMSFLLGRLSRDATMMLGAIGLATVGFSKKMISVRADFEAMEAQLLTLTGDRGAFAKVRDFALKSPLTFRASVDAVNQLVNAGVKFGDVMRADSGYLETMTKMAVFARRPLEQVVRAMSALRAGTYRSRDMQAIDVTKDMFDRAGMPWDSKKNRPEGLNAETGPEILDKVIRFQAQRLASYKPEEMLKTKLSNIEDAFDVFLNGLAKKFDSLSKPLLGRIQGLMIRMLEIIDNPAVTRALQGIGEQLAGVMDKILDTVENLMERIAKDPEIVSRFFKGVAEGLKLLASVAVGAGIGAAIASIAQAVGVLLLAFSGPGALIAVIGILVAAIAGGGGLYAWLTKLTSGMGATVDMTGLLTGEMGELVRAVDSLANTVFNGLIVAFTTLADTMRGIGGIDLGLDVISNSLKNLTADLQFMLGMILALQGYGYDQNGVLGKTQPSFADYWKGKQRTDSLTPQMIQQMGQDAIGGQPYDYNGNRARQGLPPQRTGRLLGPKDKRWPDIAAVDPNDREAASKRTLDIINSLQGGSGPICVIKTGKGVLAMGGEQAKEFHRTIFNTASTKQLAMNLSKNGQRLTRDQLQVGDFVLLDRTESSATSSGSGHTGFFLGYDSHGNMIMSGNSTGGKLKVSLDKYPWLSSSEQYTGQKGVLGFVNPFSPLRQIGMTAEETRAMAAELNAPMPLALPAGVSALTGKDALNAFAKSAAGAAGEEGRAIDAIAKLAQHFKMLADAGEGAANAMAKFGAAFLQWKQGLEDRAFNFQQNMRSIQAAFMRQSGNEQGALAVDFQMQAEQIQRMLDEASRATKERKEELRDQIASAVTGFIDQTTGIEKTAPGIFKYNQDFQSRFAERFRSLYGDDANYIASPGQQMQSASSSFRASVGSFGGAVGVFAAAVGGIGAAIAGAAANAAGAARGGAARLGGGGPVFGRGAGAAGAAAGRFGGGGPAGNRTYSEQQAMAFGSDYYGGGAGGHWEPVTDCSGGSCRTTGYKWVGGPGESGYDPSGFSGAMLEPEKEGGGDKGGGSPQEKAQSWGGVLMDALNSALQAGFSSLAQSALNGDLKGGINNALRAFAGSLVQSVAGMFGGGLMGTLLGGVASVGLGYIFGKLLGKNKGLIVEKIIDPVKIDNEDLSMNLGANPGSALYGGRGRVGGAGFNVNIAFIGEAKEVLTGWVANGMSRQNLYDGMAAI